MVEREGLDKLDRLVAELQREIDERESEIYSARVLQQARQPTNLGRMEDPDGHAAITGWCGDTMEIFFRLDGGAIREATFLTDGCGPSVACGNMVTTMVQGLSLAEAEALRPDDLILALDGLPDDSIHCAELAVQALHQALSNAQWQRTRKAEQVAAAGRTSSTQPAASRVAWASIAINVVLSLLNLAIATASGSLAVAAEMVHNLVDLVASMAVLAGVKISERESRDFPYGLYKVENVVAVAVAILIFFTGYEIAQEAIRGEAGPATVNGWILAGVALSAVIPLAFSRYEMRVGQQINSPSLMADAQEYRAHVFSSGVVFLALIGQIVGFPLDRYAALVIVVLIAKTGWELLVDGMRVLLDASLDTDTLEQVRTIIAADPAVTDVRSLAGRNAGRYRFLEADVALRVDDLEKAHNVSRRIEDAIRAAVPHVERVRIHYEPRIRSHLRYAVPLADPGGSLSSHFGEAPHFALLTVRTADGQVERQETLPNPYMAVEKAKGIRVGEWLVGLKADVVVLREDLHGKGPAYVFADAGVETRLTAATTLGEVLATEMVRAPERRSNGGDGTGDH